VNAPIKKDEFKAA